MTYACPVWWEFVCNFLTRIRKFSSSGSIEGRMVGIITRDTHVDAIRRIYEFASADNFHTRLIREIRTRLNHLHDQWRLLQTAHVSVLYALEDEDQRDSFGHLPQCRNSVFGCRFNHERTLGGSRRCW